jgi:hypothetical protein
MDGGKGYGIDMVRLLTEVARRMGVAPVPAMLL